MRIAYLMLVHDNPSHFKRIVERLSSDRSMFFVHVDKKADIELFRDVERADVSFCVERLDCAWGHISLVDATLALVRQALSHKDSYDYFVLLSGACYPIRSREYIEEFFEREWGKEFIEVFKVPNTKYGKPIERLSCYWIRKSGPFRFLKWRVQDLINVTVRRRYETALGAAEPMAGSQWWALSQDAIRFVMDFLERNKRFYNFFSHADCPDELVFQTILWNSKFRDRISHTLTFTYWARGSQSPEIIDDTFLDIFRSTPVLNSSNNNCPNEKREVIFARKFNAHSAVLDSIDRLIMD